MGWSDLSICLRSIIAGGAIGLFVLWLPFMLLGAAMGATNQTLDPLFTFILILALFIGGIIGYSVACKKEDIKVSEDRQASYDLKSVAFVLFDIPIGLLASFFAAIGLSVPGRMVACSLGINVFCGGGRITVSSFLMPPILFIFLIFTIFSVVHLFKIHRDLEEKECSKTSAIVRIVFGIPAWLGLIGLIFLLIMILFSF